MLRPGIYEQLIDRRLAQELDQLPENQKATAAIDQAEASSVLSQYVADVVRKALERMHDGKSELPDQVALVNQLVAMIDDGAATESLARSEDSIRRSENGPMTPLRCRIIERDSIVS